MNKLGPLRRDGDWTRKACVRFKVSFKGEVVSRALQGMPGCMGGG